MKSTPNNTYRTSHPDSPASPIPDSRFPTPGSEAERSDLRFAYNTNGAANHRLDDALGLIAEAGYDGVALTLDHHHMDPFAPDLVGRSENLARRLEALGLGVVIETGARFLLDGRRKHEPTLLSPEPEGRALRLEFLHRCVEIAAATGAEAVSFWAGVPRRGVEPEDARRWLLDGVLRLVERGTERGITVALEPEPGMLVETLDDYREVARQAPDLKMALDTGHCLVTGEREPAEAVREFANALGTVAIEDMKRGVHEHLPFGQGDMDVPGVLRAIEAARFTGLVCVELSRESHRAHEAIPEALKFLRNTAEQAPEMLKPTT